MAFFKSFQTLPSVNISSILDSVTSRVDDLANAVSDATYAVSDQLTEQVTTIMNKVQEEEVTENGNTPERDQATQEGKTFWQMSRDSDSGNAASKSNQSNDGAEGENTQSQMEWEWRDGCWRVKKTETELEEEERRKKEEKEQQERREQRRRDRRQKQLEKEAMSQRQNDESKEGQEEEATEVSDTLESSKDQKCGDQLTAQEGSDDLNETAQSLNCKTETGVLKNEEEKEEDGSKGEADNEEEADLSPPSSNVKKKKPDQKPKSSSDTSKKSEKHKKSKKKGDPEEAVSGSEEEKDPEAVTPENPTSAWSVRCKQSSEQEGFSSEASSEQAVPSIQRMRKDSSISELQPPPYQDESSGAHRSSRSRSDRGLRSCDSPPCSSEASMDQDAESCLNKGCEEDIPSDSTAVLGPEDGSGPRLPKVYEPEPLAKYGTLDVAFEYDSSEQWLAVTVTAATDIPALKQTGNISWQVHLVLLPTKKQRAKTGVQKGPCPVFTETFKFSRVEQEALGDCAVRFRLYSIRRMKKEKVLGEKVFHLTKLNLQGKIALPVTLEPGSELTGCGSLVSVSRSAGALSYRSTEDSLPEILLGLIYNSTTGRLSAEVIQGNHFKTAASDKPIRPGTSCMFVMTSDQVKRPQTPDVMLVSKNQEENGAKVGLRNNGDADKQSSLKGDLFCCVKHFVGGQLYIMRDTYVKLTMLDSKGKEMSKCKTATCRGHPNPTYKETFVFQVALFQLSEVSLVVSVFCRRSSMRPRERLGWVSLGHNSSSEEQEVHWTEMREAEGQQVCHWHTLTDT